MRLATTSCGLLRILVAEDNAAIQKTLAAFLDHAGVQSRIVGDGLALVEAWREGAWDLVLTDIEMPGLNGLAAARRIRAEERERGLAPTPILAITASAAAYPPDVCAAAGVDGLLPKPIVFATLGSVMSQLLEHGRPAGDPGPDTAGAG